MGATMSVIAGLDPGALELAASYRIWDAGAFSCGLSPAPA